MQPLIVNLQANPWWTKSQSFLIKLMNVPGLMTLRGAKDFFSLKVYVFGVVYITVMLLSKMYGIIISPTTSRTGVILDLSEARYFCGVNRQQY